jgi:peptidoglycan/LPS O-acetylase OafA/YrhL
MRPWPPILWPLMAVASLLVLMGLGPRNTTTLVIGVLLILLVFGVSAYLALRGRDRPLPEGFKWVLAAVVGFYAINTAVAAIAGTKYVFASVLASLIPISGALLLMATMRAKSAQAGGRPLDPTAADAEDASPGIGMDDDTPLGDTPEHSDAERVATPDRRFER